jgi:hypothetical protein
MPSAGFEPTIPAFVRAKTVHALDRAATVIGLVYHTEPAKETECFPVPEGSQSSVVGIATGYGIDDCGVGVRVPAGSRMFSSPRRPDRL